MAFTRLQHASSPSLTLMRSRCGFHLHTDVSQKIGWLSDDSSSLRSDVRENEEFVAVQFSLAIPSPLFCESGTVSQREEIMGLRDEVVCLASTYMSL